MTLGFADPVVTPEEASIYLGAVGAVGWPSDAAAQAQAILRGQRYVAARYNALWLVEWADETPQAVKHAICEAAILEARAPGSLSVVSNPSADKVLVQAGKLAWERVKGPGGWLGWQPRSSLIEGLLRGLIKPDGGSSAFLLRA